MIWGHLPSKELLIEILGQDRKTPCNKLEMEVGNNYLIIDDWIKINIYELSHRCKEWAYKNDYALFTGKDWVDGDDMWFCLEQQKYKSEVAYCKWNEADTEPEAIFKACEWILKESK